MADSFQAYTLHTVLAETGKKVTALEAVGDGLYVGLADGSLLRLAPDSSKSVAEPWQVTRTHKTFGKKTVTALKVSRASLGSRLSLHIACP